MNEKPWIFIFNLLNGLLDFLVFLEFEVFWDRGLYRDGEYCVTTGPGWEIFADQMTQFTDGYGSR